MCFVMKSYRNLKQRQVSSGALSTYEQNTLETSSIYLESKGSLPTLTARPKSRPISVVIPEVSYDKDFKQTSAGQKTFANERNKPTLDVKNILLKPDFRNKVKKSQVPSGKKTTRSAKSLAPIVIKFTGRNKKRAKLSSANRKKTQKPQNYYSYISIAARSSKCLSKFQVEGLSIGKQSYE